MRDWAADPLRNGGYVLIAVLVVANVFFAVDTARRSATVVETTTFEAAPAIRPTDSPAAGVEPARRPVVSFLGNSYLTGFGSWRSFAIRAAEAGNWQWAVHGAEDAGFAETGSGQGFADFVTEVSQDDPDLVIVVSGVVDREASTENVAEGATGTLTALRAALPKIPILVIGPFTDSLPVDAETLGQRDAVRDAAAEVGDVAFVDPLEQEWLTSASDIQSDGTKLAPSAERDHADRLLRAVDDLGLPAPFGG